MPNQASSVASQMGLQIQQYKVTSCEKAEPPTGAEGKNWYRYVVDNGRSQITAYCQGTKKQVNAHTSDFVEKLNARLSSTRSPYWAPARSKKS